MMIVYSYRWGLGCLALMSSLTFAGSALAQIRVGVAGPMTGPMAVFGEQMKRGVQAAAEAINKAGGIDGQQIEIVIGDDRADPKEGVSVANKFVSDGVHFVVGHFNSGVSIPASDVYKESGTLQISPSSTNTRYTDRGLWNVFRSCGRDDQQGAVAAQYILKKMPGKRIALIHDKTPAGKGVTDEVKKGLNAGGFTEVMYDAINPGEKDLGALVSRLKATSVDAVYYGGAHTEAGLMVRQMRDQGLSTVLIGADALKTDEFWAIAGPGATGTLMTFGSDPTKNQAAKNVVAEFRARGVDPEGYTLYSYAALELIKGGIKAAKSVDPKVVAATLRDGRSFPTVLGPISFDEKGDITNPDYVVYVWSKDGSYTEVGE